MKLWALYGEVMEARINGDTKAEIKAQRRLDAAKEAARKAIAERLK
jgi:hypothetical protein